MIGREGIDWDLVDEDVRNICIETEDGDIMDFNRPVSPASSSFVMTLSSDEIQVLRHVLDRICLLS